MEYDKIFDDATVKDLDFEVIFDEEDSIIEQVVGFGENGESLIGRDPEELTTDNDDSKVDIEGSSSDTTLKDGDGAEIKESGEIDLDNLFAECGLEPGKGGDAEEQTDETDKKDVLEEPDEVEDKDFHDESVDLDNLFSEAEIEDTDDDDILDGSEEGTKEDKLSEAEEEQTDETDKKDVLAEPDEIEDKDFHDESVDLDNLFTEGEDLCPKCGSNPCTCGLEPGKGGKAEEQTDETDKKDVLAEPDEVEEKDFHDESVDLDKLFEGCGEGCEGCSEEGEDIPATDAVEDDEDLEESYNIGGAKHINWFGEESIEAETDTEDELINAADNNDSAQNLNLDYQVGLDDEVIDDLIDSDI